MSKLGYFLGGAVVGIAGLTAAAFLSDYFWETSSETLSTATLDTGDSGDIEAPGDLRETVGETMRESAASLAAVLGVNVSGESRAGADNIVADESFASESA